MTRPYPGHFVGILGGMGPLAGATLLTRLTLLTRASRDQDHVPAILWSDPRVPDRQAARLRGGEDPLPWMLHGIQQLESAGARLIAIPCNTAHLWFDALARGTHVRLLHIVQCVLENLQAEGVHEGRIGLMGAAATIESGLYQDMLAKAGYECIMLDPEDFHAHCLVPIEQVKTNQLEAARQALRPGIRRLREQGAAAVILGCTELPLALPHADRNDWGMTLIDSTDALALAAIRWHASQPGA